MNKHTPGPWVIHADQPNIVNAPHAGHFIADVFSGHRASKANTQLIAAAPELLEALQAVLMETMDFPPHQKYDTDSYLPLHLVQKVRAAIAKATGEQA